MYNFMYFCILWQVFNTVGIMVHSLCDFVMTLNQFVGISPAGKPYISYISRSYCNFMSKPKKILGYLAHKFETYLR